MMRVITSKDVPAYQVLNSKASESIVSLELQDKAKLIDGKKGTFVIETEAVETSRIGTQEYIDSFKDDVGVENILRKFQLVNDPELLVQVKRPSIAIAEDGMEQVQDYTGLPKSEEDALKLAKRARMEFERMPPELTKGRSLSQFAETCTKEELLAFIASQNKKKEGEE